MRTYSGVEDIIDEEVEEEEDLQTNINNNVETENIKQDINLNTNGKVYSDMKKGENGFKESLAFYFNNFIKSNEKKEKTAPRPPDKTRRRRLNISWSCEGALACSAPRLMNSYDSSNSVSNHSQIETVPGAKFSGKQAVADGPLSKEEAEKRFKSWKRTTIVRRRSEN